MREPLRILAVGSLVAAAVPAGLSAQSVLDRSPNVSGNWVGSPGTVEFNFLHRFMRAAAPTRKISNFPTFLLATSFLRGTSLGFNYSTNSSLAPNYPNEWEFFARVLPLTQAKGFPVDLGGQLDYNLAARGVDGEVSLARTVGPVRLIGLGRALTNPDTTSNKVQWALGGGLSLRLTRHVALAGDVVTLTKRNSAAGERVAWSAGIQLGIPNTPHTLSLQVANTNTATLQGSSRGGAERRYGFEFTIPITLARYFGRHPKTPSTSEAAPTGPGGTVSTGMLNLAYKTPILTIKAGTTIEWTNDDQLPHTVTADDGSFESELIDAGGTWRHTFSTPGTYTFHCTPHPFMKGTVVVQ